MITAAPLISPVSNQKCLKRIRAYLEERRPTTIVLRDESARRFRGRDRTRKLLADIKRIAQDLDIHAFCYSRKNIIQVFERHGVRTKPEIAEQIVEWLPMLKQQLPPVRKKWDSEHYRISLFDAVALVYTHHHYINGSTYVN